MRIAPIAVLITFSVSAARADDVSGTVSGVADLDNVVVYLEHVDGTFAPSTSNAVMDQKNMEFVPHVLPVLSGTTVDFPNSDTVRHNVFSPTKTKRFNLGIYPVGVTKHQVMDIPGAQAISLLCAIHAELAAYVVVLQNPYYAMAGKDGAFTIKDVPAGTYTIVAWHEKQPSDEIPLRKITVGRERAKVTLAFKTDYGHTGARRDR